MLFFTTLHSYGYIFPLLLCLSLLFSAIFKASSDNRFACLHFLFLGMVLTTVSCTILQTSIHSSSGTLSDLVPWSESICHIHSIILRDLIYVTPGFSSGFLYFAQFKFEFCIEKLVIWATDSSVLFLLTVQNFSIFDYKEYNQFDFSIDHLVISMCTIFSCVVGRGYLL